jgi:mRNA interferase MazF
MVKAYIPGPGDIVWLEFDPQAGREQAGRRPAVVLSPSAYNKKNEFDGLLSFINSN